MGPFKNHTEISVFVVFLNCDDMIVNISYTKEVNKAFHAYGLAVSKMTIFSCYSPASTLREL